MLELQNIEVKIGRKKILQDVSMEFESSKVYAILGPNGSGKTTLAKAIMGIQKISKGKILFESKDITKVPPEKRAKMGIFLAFQQTPELDIQIKELLFGMEGESLEEKIKGIKEFKEALNIELERSLKGLSGGEKKKIEIFEFLIKEPKLAILDEPDSGVDIDSFKTIVKAINFARKNFNPCLLIISHYQEIFNYIKPDFVYILKNGKVVKSGGADLVEYVRKYGYNHEE
ncbi:MAG: ABC transporter ATP-binding protein [Candidatus Micrarchaeia archaeon]